MMEVQNVSMILIILYLAVKDVIAPLIKKVTNGGGIKDSSSDLWKKINTIADDVAETKTSLAVVETKIIHIEEKIK